MKNQFIKFLSVFAFLAIFTSCSYEEEFENIKSELDALKESVSQLQNAYNSGKTITEVSPISGDQADGWKIIFSDGSSIDVKEGKDGVTPYVKIDENNTWVVSYDNGKTYSQILDTEGNSIVAVGKDGVDGNSVRVVSNDQSYYVIEIYNSATGEVVDTIVTKYSSDPKNAIKSIVEDNKTNTITIKMESGEEFVFMQGVTDIRFTSFNFLAKNNPVSLISDVEFDIVGDSLLSCFIPYMIEDRSFVPTFECADAVVMLGEGQVVSGKTELDCSMPLELKLVSENTEKIYKLQVRCFTGLPIVYINTEDKKEIDSKEEYVKGTIRIVSNNVNGVPDFEASMKIKGRGNSTWQMAKKPYKIKFDSKVSLLGEPEDKEWVLLANYADKTQLRNEIAFFMGEMSTLEYTPRTNFVEVVLNGVYNGTYQLGEQLKISKNRVNVGDDGFLLEIDGKAAEEDITFKVSHIGQPINIKDPDVEVGSDDYNFVVNYLNTTDQVLFSEDFADPVEGYKKYIDVESFVDWYLINEITKNPDSRFFTSCYMNLSREGKLKMGPLWDFDIAFGNIDYHPQVIGLEGFWVKTSPWFTRLFEDPAFVSLVKERFAYFYGKQNEIFLEINHNAEYLQYAAVENNNKWGTLYNYTWPNYEILGKYQNEVQNMKNWLSRRFEWLNTAISEL